MSETEETTEWKEKNRVKRKLQHGGGQLFDRGDKLILEVRTRPDKQHDPDPDEMVEALREDGESLEDQFDVTTTAMRNGDVSQLIVKPE